MTPHPGGFSVLVVSAELSIRQTRVLLLEEAGHTTQVAESCAQAKAVLQLTKFNLVMLDHTLNKNDRVDLIRFIRNIGSTTPVLLLHKSGADCGADLHLDSREGPDALISATDSIIQHATSIGRATSIAGESKAKVNQLRGGG